MCGADCQQTEVLWDPGLTVSSIHPTECKKTIKAKPRASRMQPAIELTAYKNTSLVRVLNYLALQPVAKAT